jgi:hypothetical protein
MGSRHMGGETEAKSVTMQVVASKLIAAVEMVSRVALTRLVTRVTALVHELYRRASDVCRLYSFRINSSGCRARTFCIKIHS